MLTHISSNSSLPIEAQVEPVIKKMSEYKITELLGQGEDGKTVFTKGIISGLEGPAVVLFETNSIDLEKVKMFLSEQSGELFLDSFKRLEFKLVLCYSTLHRVMI